MPQFSKTRWPDEGPVRALLEYLDRLHRKAGQPSLAEMGRAVALAPSTLSTFFTGTRLISQGNLELLVEHLGGDTQRAERLRRRAATAWNTARVVVGPEGRATPDESTEHQSADVRGAVDRLDIVVFDQPVNRFNRPARLFGRQQVIEDLTQRLDAGERILLHGLAGSGKTALAATLADDYLASGHGPYLWLRTTSPDVELLLDAILRRLGTSQSRSRVAELNGDARLLALQDVVREAGVSLCVLDDVWHPGVLHSFVRAVPESVPVIATSRLKLVLDHVVEVGGLPPAEAAPLLALHAKDEAYAWHPDADELCRVLGYHPYAIEIAGSHLRQYNLAPAELRDVIAGSPHALRMPGGFAEPGRESIGGLLERTYQALENPDGRRALAAFGAFYSATATVQLLSTYLGFDLVRTRTALNVLVDLSLARRLRDTSYEIHDLTYSYVRVTEDNQAAIFAVRDFVKAYSHDYELLAAEFANILGAATRAHQEGIESFVDIVEAIAVGGYLDDRGHTLAFLRLLDTAIDAVRSRDGERGDRLHLLLSKRGNAAYNQGSHAAALTSYRAALRIASNPSRQTVLLAVIGKLLTELGDHTQADRHFTEAYAVAEAHNDDAGLLRVVEQQCIAAFRRQRFEVAKELAVKGVDLSRRLAARTLEAVFLNNLGSADFELGVRASLERHLEANAIAAELHDDDVLALTHRTIGIDHHAQEDHDSARHHLTEALRLYQRLGQAERESRLREMMGRFGYL